MPEPVERVSTYYPAFLDLQGRRVVVVGGGTIATGKVHGLLPCGPEPLEVIAPEASDVIQTEAREGRLLWRPRAYRPDDLAGAFVVFAATNDRVTNARVAAEARAARALVLTVDDAPNCDFIAPAIVRRGDVVVAVSTGGRSPALARRAREWLEEALPEHWGDLLDVAAAVRGRLSRGGRRVTPAAWQSALDSSVEGLVARGHLDEAEAVLLGNLTRTFPYPPSICSPQGIVGRRGPGEAA